MIAHLTRVRLSVLLSISLLLFGGFSAGTGFAKETDQETPLAGISSTLSVVQFTGTATDSIPISVPLGRNGMQPQLGLTYSSANGNGWLGKGWIFELGKIQRQTRFGVNYGNDDYALRLNGASVDLTKKTPDDGYFWAQIEGAFTRIQKRTDSLDGKPYFLATDRMGKKYRFGYTPSARVTSSNGTSIFQWNLDRIEDLDGNYLTVTYWNDQGQSYLDRIDYAGNGTMAPTNYIKFYREVRTDASPMYTSGFVVTTGYRLKTIEVRANGSLVRAYRLAYGASTETAASLLTSIRQFDKNATITTASGPNQGDVSGNSLPPLTFQYTGPEGTPSYFQDNGMIFGTSGLGPSHIGPPPSPGQPNPFYPSAVGDVNGDGIADLIRFKDNNPSAATIEVNLAGGPFDPTFLGWLAVSVMPCGSRLQFQEEVTVGTADFNGDGKADVWCSSTTRGFHMGISNGTSFAMSQPVTSGVAVPPILADMNGDGKADWVNFFKGTSFFPLSVAVSFSTGTGFDFANGQTWWSGQWCGNVGSRRGGGAADFNGDGKADLYCINDASGIYAVLSTGSSFVMTATSPPWYAGAIPAQTKVIVGEVNGDGKADVLLENGVSVGVALSTGTGFGALGNWAQLGSAYWCGDSGGFEFI